MGFRTDRCVDGGGSGILAPFKRALNVLGDEANLVEAGFERHVVNLNRGCSDWRNNPDTEAMKTGGIAH